MLVKEYVLLYAKEYILKIVKKKFWIRQQEIRLSKNML